MPRTSVPVEPEAGASALVLAGGGAKGAYEVGVWKAMQEMGIDKTIKVISGTSIGAINASLFASVSDATKIESFWTDNVAHIVRRINFSKVKKEWRDGLAVAGDVIRRRLSLGSLAGAIGVVKDKLLSIFGEEYVGGWVDPRDLRGAIEANLPYEWGKNAPVVYATSLCKGPDFPSWKRRVFKLNDEPFDRKVDMLRASSAIPVVFDNVEVDGCVYVDGGWALAGGENVPITPVLENHPEIKTIYVVYLDARFSLKLDRFFRLLGGDPIDTSRFPEKRIVKIVPSKSLKWVVGALNFSPRTARRLFKLGYADARRALEK